MQALSASGASSCANNDNYADGLGRNRMLQRLCYASATVAVLFIAGCATNAATGKQDLMLVSTDEEVQLADKEHNRFLGSPGLYSDAALMNYVGQVGAKVVTGSERKDVEYRFFILNQTDVNAFALPNGHIYVTRGLLTYLGSEAELAAVLAHEAGHVTARHSAQLMSSAKVAGAASTVVGLLAGAAVGAATGNVDLAMSTMNAASGASAMTGLVVIGSYSREHELEADQLATRYLSRSGYPPASMIAVLDTLKAIEKFDEARRTGKDKRRNLYHQVATHPEVEERIEKAEAASGSTASQPAVSDSTYLEQTAGLVFEAFGETNPFQNRPDIGLNREARFQFYLPQDWKTVENTKNKVVLDKSAEKLSTTIQLLPPQSDRDPKKLFSGERLHATTISELTELKPVHHEVPAYSAIAKRGTPDGNGVVYVAVLFHEQYTILLTGTPKDEAWLKTHRYVFDAQANLMKVLTEAEYGQRLVKRIRLVKAKAGDTYASLAKQSPLGETGERYLRLLNRQYPTGEPVADSTIKIVVADP